MTNNTKGGLNQSRILALTIGLFLIFSMNTVIINSGESNIEEYGVYDESDGAMQDTEIDNNIQASVQLPTGTTSPTQLFLQVQNSTIAGYKNLSIEPFEANIQEVNTPEIPVGGGSYKLGDAWITDVLPEPTNISGSWLFKISGKISGPTVNGTLRAEVYSLTSGWLFSAPSTESAAGHSTYYNFTWTYDVPNGTEIPANDRIFVEFWFDANFGGPVYGQTTNPDFDVGCLGWTYHSWGEPHYPWGFWQPINGNPDGNIGISFVHGDADVIIQNGGYWEQPFTPTSTPTSATLEFDWRCGYYGIFPPAMTVSVCIDSISGVPSNAVWSQFVSDTTPWASIGPLNVSSIVTSASTYYLKVVVWTVTGGDGDDYNVTFDNVGVTWTLSPSPKFTLGYDCVSTPSSISMYLINSNPLPATNVHAKLTGTNDVTIYWTASASPDVDHYEIWYRVNNFNMTGDGYIFKANVGLSTNYVHANTGNNSSSSFYWQVRTYNVAGHETRSSIQAGKIGMTLNHVLNPSGWFLLGSPITQDNYSLDNVIQGFGFPNNWDYVNVYNVWDDVDPWKTYLKGRPDNVNDLNNISNTQGFWLHINDNSRWCTAGQAINLNISLKAGWNMVSYPTFNPETVANALGGTGADKVAVFDPAEPYHIKEVDPTYLMKPGEGYWVHVPFDTIWIVNW